MYGDMNFYQLTTNYMNQAINLIDEMIEEVRNPWKEWETMHKTQVLKELRDKLSSLHSDTQWIDAIKRVQSLIDIELYDHD